MARNEIELQLRSFRDVAPGTRHFVFARVDDEPVKFHPGQFLMMHFESDGAAHSRSYSLANDPADADTYELSVAFVEGGRGSRILWALQPGERIRATVPHGRFVLRQEPVRRYILVCTGTGIAPYRAMVGELTRRMRDESLRVTLLLGVREPADLLYAEEWLELMHAYPSFSFFACYSRIQPEAPQPWERKGYVQGAIADMTLEPEHDIVYLCGNPNMVDQAIELLTEKGYSPLAIRREKYT
jgi:ferredoxin-NADP reductase